MRIVQSIACPKYLIHWLAMTLLCLVLPAVAAPLPFALPTLTQSAPETSTVSDPFGRDTPRTSVQGFLSALGKEDRALYGRYIEGEATDADVQRLIDALDAGGQLLGVLELSDQPSGHLDDQLPKDLDKVGEVVLDGHKIELMMVKRGDIWQFAQSSIDALPKSKPNDARLINQMRPAALEGVHILGYDMADVVALGWLVLGLLFGIYFALRLIYLPIFVVRVVFKKPKPKAGFILPATLVLFALSAPYVLMWAGAGVLLRLPIVRISHALFWVGAAWFLLGLCDFVYRHLARAPYLEDSPERLSLLVLVRRIMKLLALGVAFVFFLGNLGVDLKHGMLGLGIGGLALALGAQKTIENLVGSLVVVADKPVRVGDYCKFGTYEGVVTDIGIRSTRVRTLNRTQVTIPNGQFSSLQIENYGARDMFEFLHLVHLDVRTPATQVKDALTLARDYIAGHPKTNDEWTQVQLVRLGLDALVLQVRVYVDVPNIRAFYDVETQMLLELMTLFENAGIALAVPVRQVALDTH